MTSALKLHSSPPISESPCYIVTTTLSESALDGDHHASVFLVQLPTFLLCVSNVSAKSAESPRPQLCLNAVSDLVTYALFYSATLNYLNLWNITDLFTPFLWSPFHHIVSTYSPPNLRPGVQSASTE
ncbi:unnamed protein product [Protopolystoma xenopodis]|uniref:Uncharacterized protein n=1 Tax=Protopolystoma xenopodis TaxID=117903 RepID=A0A3S5BX31_9PLAT|nr:unnamed protein product [Protopolystoma xenopodis]